MTKKEIALFKIECLKIVVETNKGECSSSATIKKEADELYNWLIN